MPNYTREELINKTALMNQMRNNLFHFLRYLFSKGFSNNEIKERVDRMGENIATTFLENKSFQKQELEELVHAIYLDIFESKISITQLQNQLTVEDKKCALCKYHREDLTIAPCRIITSLVAEICSQCGYPIKDFSVKKSVALGEISCIHSYNVLERDD